MKQLKRLADIRGKGIKNRCRKEERVYLDAIGLTDEEAIASLLQKLETETPKYRVIEWGDTIRLYDVEVSEWSISRPIFPSVGQDNYKTESLQSIQKQRRWEEVEA